MLVLQQGCQHVPEQLDGACLTGIGHMSEPLSLQWGWFCDDVVVFACCAPFLQPYWKNVRSMFAGVLSRPCIIDP